MKKIKVKFNDIDTKLIKSPGCYKIASPGDIIEVDQKEFDRKLKNWKNLNGENIYIPVEEQKKEVKKEEPTEETKTE